MAHVSKWLTELRYETWLTDLWPTINANEKSHEEETKRLFTVLDSAIKILLVTIIIEKVSKLRTSNSLQSDQKYFFINFHYRNSIKIMLCVGTTRAYTHRFGCLFFIWKKYLAWLICKDLSTIFNNDPIDCLQIFILLIHILKHLKLYRTSYSFINLACFLIMVKSLIFTSLFISL